MKRKVNIDKRIITKLLDTPQSKLDRELIEILLKNIVNRVQKEKLYSESSWIVEEYCLLQHSLDALYSFIYKPNQSNLSLKDAQVFASYVVQQSKKLKDIINILFENKIEISRKKEFLKINLWFQFLNLLFWNMAFFIFLDSSKYCISFNKPKNW